MKSLLNVLSAEVLKLKRTNAARMVVIAPLSVVGLVTFLAANVTTLVLNQRIELWLAFTRVVLIFWASLMLPLYITLETALVAGVDHSENHWKILMARPVPRWTFYVAKLLIVVAMTILSMLLLLLGILAAGFVLPRLRADLRFASVIPMMQIVQKVAEVAGLGCLSLAIQHWVSLRWRSFTVASAVGIVGMVTGYGMLFTAGRGSPGLAIYHPWSFPMLALANEPSNLGSLIGLAVLLGIAASAVGCWDFARRDVE